MTAVVLPRAVRQAIVAHAKRDAPRECCGFLIGRARTVVAACPMSNVASGTTRFRIDDRAHIALRRVLRRFEPPLEIVGVYHSHPEGPARPSSTDVAEAHYPEWIHVIASPGGATGFRLAAFRIVGLRVKDVTLSGR